MPRDERRPVRFSAHAQRRMRQRGIDPDHAERIVRHGGTRPDADCDFIAAGEIAGRYLEAACLDLGDGILVKTVY